MMAQLVTPSGLDKPIRSLTTARSELLVAGRHTSQLYLATCLILLGLGALAAAFSAIGTLCRRKGRTPAMVAAVVAAVACVCGIAVNSLVSLNLAGVSREGPAPASVAPLLVSENAGPVSTAILVGYVGGLASASVLMAVGLWRAGVGRWIALLFPVSLVLGSLSPPGPIGVLLSIPVAIVMVLLGRRLWQSADASSSSRPTVTHV
jgi:hypothetical protein